MDQKRIDNHENSTTLITMRTNHTTLSYHVYHDCTVYHPRTIDNLLDLVGGV